MPHGRNSSRNASESASRANLEAAYPARQAELRAGQQRLDRQRWLSRLLVATPQVLAAAEYARIRRQIEPATEVGSQPRGRGRGAAAQVLVASVAPGGLVIGAPEPAAPPPVTPIGFVNGASLAPGVARPAPQVADDRTAAAVMETRGRRRAKEDIATGFADLNPSDEQGETT